MNASKKLTTDIVKYFVFCYEWVDFSIYVKNDSFLVIDDNLDNLNSIWLFEQAMFKCNVHNHVVFTVGFSSHNGIFFEVSFKFCLQFPQSLWHILVSDRTICPHHSIAWHPHWGLHRNIHATKKYLLLLLKSSLNWFPTNWSWLVHPLQAQKTQVNYFHRTRVRSLAMLVTRWLTHSLTHPCLVNLIDVTCGLLRLLLLLMLMMRNVLTKVLCRFESWSLVIKLNFVQTLSTRFGQEI